MPDFDVKPGSILVFHVGDEYLFSHFFDRTDVFEALSDYYNEDAYRFEVPDDDFDDVRDLLAEEYFELVVVDDLEPYCVVKETYTKHADILRNSVANWERDGHLFFLMKDDLSVLEAEEQGATRITETEFVVGL